MGYGNQEVCMPSTGSVRSLTVSERLYQQKKDLTERLDLVNLAIDAVTKNPDIQLAIDAISKIGF